MCEHTLIGFPSGTSFILTVNRNLLPLGTSSAAEAPGATQRGTRPGPVPTASSWFFSGSSSGSRLLASLSPLTCGVSKNASGEVALVGKWCFHVGVAEIARDAT